MSEQRDEAAEIHAAVMNLPANGATYDSRLHDELYKCGHRDARHAAAELARAAVAKVAAERAALRAELDRIKAAAAPFLRFVSPPPTTGSEDPYFRVDGSPVMTLAEFREFQAALGLAYTMRGEPGWVEVAGDGENAPGRPDGGPAGTVAPPTEVRGNGDLHTWAFNPDGTTRRCVP